MKYILQEKNGVFDLTEYEDYLDRKRGVLAALVHGDNLLMSDRFVPTGPESFHDSRFLGLSAATDSEGSSDSEAQTVRVELRLKGPYFDRSFELSYSGVVSCGFQVPAPGDDLLMHEVRVDDGVITHELKFDNAKSIVIACREMRFLERLDSGMGVAKESHR